VTRQNNQHYEISATGSITTDTYNKLPSQAHVCPCSIRNSCLGKSAYLHSSCKIQLAAEGKGHCMY